MPWLFFLKASAEVESADHLYPVEDGFRKQYTDFGGETKRQQVNRSKSVGVGLRYRYRYRLQASSMSPHRSSSRAMDLLRNHAAKLLSFRPYAIVVLRVEGILSRMLYIQNVEQ